MTFIDTGIRGATGQSWRRANPRDLLKRVIDDHPGADRPALFKLFLEKLKEEEDTDYLDTIVEYWFANNYHSLVAARTTSEETRPGRAASAAERDAWIAATKEKVKEKVTEAATIVLSEMIMPNGKQLAACTGQECGQLRSRMGSWLGKIARRVKPEETVGAILNEDGLQALYQNRG
jgi:hypothetical protein